MQVFYAFASSTAVVANVTVTGPSGGGYLTVWPAGTDRPEASTVNFGAGETVPNLAVIGVGEAGAISIFDYLYEQVGSVNVLVDVVAAPGLFIRAGWRRMARRGAGVMATGASSVTAPPTTATSRYAFVVPAVRAT